VEPSCKRIVSYLLRRKRRRLEGSRRRRQG